MSYNLKDEEMYMMPVHFGPATGPRRGPDGKRFVYDKPTRSESLRLIYETEPQLIEKILPTGFELLEPVVIIDHVMLRDIAWLAGRGYNMLGVNVPVRYSGKVNSAEGALLTVLWENHADPIITGREQLGFSKIYADISDLETHPDGKISGSASSWGFPFYSMKADLQAEPEDMNAINNLLSRPMEGVFHLKYIPHTGEGFNSADVNCVTMSPMEWKPDDLDVTSYPEQSIEFGRGSMEWNVPTWEQMPTQSHIVKGLSQLKVKRWIGAVKSVTYTSNDLYGQHVIS